MVDDREAILARRRRLIALALAGGAVATTACGEPCLTFIDAPMADAPTDAPDAGASDDAPEDDAGDGDGG